MPIETARPRAERRVAARPGQPRRRAWALLPAVALAAAGLATGILPGSPAPAARATDGTASQNNLRDGWDPTETHLTPAVLRSGAFHRVFSTAVSGQVYAQPVVAGKTLIVATENDWVYGLNQASGAIEWSRKLGTPWPMSSSPCSTAMPNVGVTSTPVYDPGTGTVYLVSEVVPRGSSDRNPEFLMQAISAQTGAERPGWPVPIKGAPANDPGRPFVPFDELQRPGLLLLGGSVFAGFGSHCDNRPYAGYVAGVSTHSRALTMWTDETGPSYGQAGIWLGGGGLMSDGPGRIFLSTGNGTSPPPAPGGKPPGNLGDAVVRLGIQPNGTLRAADFFSPANAPELDTHDLDVSSGGPVGLPFGSAADPHLLVEISKDARVFLLNRDFLGGREQGPGGTDRVVSVSGPFGHGLWGHPAVFGNTATLTRGNVASSRDYVYYAGFDDQLRVLRLGLNAAGTPVLSDVANSTIVFPSISGSPVVTSDGNSLSSAVVWEVSRAGKLYAFPAVPPTGCTGAAPCHLSPIWSAPIGTPVKFSIPATNADRVYVGTSDGHVLGFGTAVPSARASRG
ncbi:MAG TPA: PQQ-binding-like beta-propeller repeat protein [Streptosporangiaceae bacterium]|nr:PQQ-binding-like beta-propeller repeat protein [Streptosporangiaceae bacterium]